MKFSIQWHAVASLRWLSVSKEVAENMTWRLKPVTIYNMKWKEKPPAKEKNGKPTVQISALQLICALPILTLTALYWPVISILTDSFRLANPRKAFHEEGSHSLTLTREIISHRHFCDPTLPLEYDANCQWLISTESEAFIEGRTLMGDLGSLRLANSYDPEAPGESPPAYPKWRMRIQAVALEERAVWRKWMAIFCEGKLEAVNNDMKENNH